MENEPFGFLVVDKPGGMTSHDVVAQVRRGTHVKRIGHAGTLDPMATGVLVLCLGAATRLSEYVMASSKRYRTTIRLGVETDTYDADGQVTRTADVAHLSRESIESALSHFQGRVEQVPPMYSALKRDGQRLYELARAGKEVEREGRTVDLDTRLVSFDLPDVTLEVTCSAGTYIRSIAHDLGTLLGLAGHLIRLRREASGSLHEPIPWDSLIAAMAAGDWRRYLIDERTALAGLPELQLDQAAADAISNGKRLERSQDEASSTGDLCRAYAPDNRFVAILSAAGSQGEYWKPEKVFVRSSPKSHSGEPGN